MSKSKVYLGSFKELLDHMTGVRVIKLPKFQEGGHMTHILDSGRLFEEVIVENGQSKHSCVTLSPRIVPKDADEN